MANLSCVSPAKPIKDPGNVPLPDRAPGPDAVPGKIPNLYMPDEGKNIDVATPAKADKSM